MNKEKEEDLKSIGTFTEYETAGGNSLWIRIKEGKMRASRAEVYRNSTGKRKRTHHFNKRFTISSKKQYLAVARDFSYSELLDRDPVNHWLLGKFYDCIGRMALIQKVKQTNKNPKAEDFLDLILAKREVKQDKTPAAS